MFHLNVGGIDMDQILELLDAEVNSGNAIFLVKKRVEPWSEEINRPMPCSRK